MIIFDLVMEYKEEKVIEEDLSQEDCLSKKASRMNRALRKLASDEEPVWQYIYGMESNIIKAVVVMKAEAQTKLVWNRIVDFFAESLDIIVFISSHKEITVTEFRKAVSEGRENRFLNNEHKIIRELEFDYEDNGSFNVRESILETKRLTKKEAEVRANDIMLADDFKEEIDRIYSKDNRKKFFGHPVHYLLRASSGEYVKEMLELLLLSLYQNKRILSGRINEVTYISKRCYDEEDFENMVKNSMGSTVVIYTDMNQNGDGDKASVYDEAMHFVSKMMKKYGRKVLFVLVEVISKSEFSENVKEMVTDSIRFIEMSEGTGDLYQAKTALRRMIDASEYKELKDDSFSENLPQKEAFSYADVFQSYNKWVEQSIYNKAYKAYAVKTDVKVDENEKEKKKAYQKLQEMVGLDDVKALIDQIIDMHRIQKLRMETGLQKQKNSMHMIFTGNPGSAKTTVARLLAQILNEEGIIRNSTLVECGRNDLVGKYVGWTAVKVENRFKEARGGVLFIDEAYSLVDDRSGSFGDEAINTIVQQMENNRDDVVVIFAGYPDRMEEFLEKNEGLKSRIAFHLKFKDYDKVELSKILDLMMKEKEYCCNEAARQKCMDIFAAASKQKEFGNGRYVRNLFEQAIMRQSNRIMSQMQGATVKKEQLQMLIADDFNVSFSGAELPQKRIGF